MKNTDPLERYRELISEAWDVASRLRYAAKTRQLVPEDMRKVIFAEGTVVGYLEALTLTAPGLAEQAKLSTSVKSERSRSGQPGSVRRTR